VIGHYLLTALANFRKSPFTTAAKVVTLGLGLASMIMVIGIISFWRSSDSQIAPFDRVVVITTSMDADELLAASTKFSEASFVEQLGEFVDLPAFLRQDVPDLEKVASFRSRGAVSVNTGERSLALRGANAEAEFLDIFQFVFVEGDPKSALRQEDAVVLTRDSAQRLFGTTPALGRRLVLAGRREATVTGVLDTFPEGSLFAAGQLSFDYVSLMRPGAFEVEYWKGMEAPTFALLPADGSVTIDELNVQLARLVERRLPPAQQAQFSVTFAAAGVGQITERDLDATLFGDASSLSVVAALFGLATLVLAIACLNYANLAIAQSAARAREIGMRRVLGSGRLELLLQSWFEAGLATFVALVLTAVSLWLAAPVVVAHTGIDIALVLSRDPVALAGIVGVALAVTVAAGLYPAFVLARVRPVEALRDGKIRGGPRVLAHILIGIQFASASALLIAVIVVNQQNLHLSRIALNRAGDPVVYLPSQQQSGIALETLRHQLEAYPQIKAVSAGERIPWTTSGERAKLARSSDASALGQTAESMDVDYDYFEVYDQKVLAGRAYSRERDAVRVPTPATTVAADPIVIDRTYATRLGFASPQAAIGQITYRGSRPSFEIVGVVDDRPHTIKGGGRNDGTVYFLDSDPVNTPAIRISADDVEGGLAAIRRVWSQLAPGGTLAYQFEDQVFEQNFAVFRKIGSLFLALSGLAFLISSMGLFGMAVHVTQQRTHEIGVRKTLGSTTWGAVRLLLADFSKPVIVANLIAWPLGYLAAQTYLSAFAHRIDLTVWPFALSLLITLGLAWVAVSGQTYRAAAVRPAQVLRGA
jgi:putative ABC transport system permease protein